MFGNNVRKQTGFLNKKRARHLVRPEAGFLSRYCVLILGWNIHATRGSGVSPAREGVRESRGSGGTSPFPLILWPERSGRELRAWLSRAQQDDRASKKKLALPRNNPPSPASASKGIEKGEALFKNLVNSFPPTPIIRRINQKNKKTFVKFLQSTPARGILIMFLFSL